MKDRPTRAQMDRAASATDRDFAPALVPASEQLVCDACGKPIKGEPAGHGLLMWTRGEDTRVEEPPLCAACARAVTAAGLGMWDEEPGGEG